MTIPSGVTVYLKTASSNAVGTVDLRTGLMVATGETDEFKGTLIPQGDGNALINPNLSSSYLILSGPITNSAFALPSALAFQGLGSGKISGQVNINAQMEMNTDMAATWVAPARC